MPKKRRRSNTGIPGLSFFPRRALGVTSAKRNFARATGIPTTRAGRQRKIGRMVTGGGCLAPIAGLFAAILSIALLVI